jgi:hypothetical protein
MIHPLTSISLHTANLCDALGIEKRRVFRMEIEPRLVRVLLYAERPRESDGRMSKYIGDDGEPAMEVKLFAVRT